MKEVILRRLVRPHIEEKKTTRRKSSDLDMPSHLNGELGSGWVTVEEEEKKWDLVLGVYVESVR